MMASRDRTSSVDGGLTRHIPVMLSEVLTALKPADGEIIVDGTFGAGGYAQGILDAADCKVIAIDRDAQAFAIGGELANTYPGRLIPALGCYSEMETLAEAEGFSSVDGVTLDLGVSSMHLDRPERGFSFRLDGPLDMRMEGADAPGPSAADLVKKRGAKKVYVGATHGVLAGPALERLQKAPIEEVVVTDTIPLTEAAKKVSCIKVLTVAEMLGEAISRIHNNESVSSLF